MSYLDSFRSSLVPMVTSLIAISAQTQSSNYQGHIRYQDSSPAQSVRVELWTEGRDSWRTVATSDWSGKFEAAAPCAPVQFKIEVPGYRAVHGRTEIPGKPCRATAEITLTALPMTRVLGRPIVNARLLAIPPAASREFESGYAALQKDDSRAAIPHLLNAITLYPRFAEAYQLLGVVQLQLHEGEQAESSLVKAVEIENNMPRAQYLLGVLYAMTGRASLAEKPLTRFAELDPQNPDAYFELAKVKFALSKFHEAEINARKAIDLREPNKGVAIVLGYALLRQNKPDEARQAFQLFVQENPASPMSPDVRYSISQIDAHKEESKNSPPE